MRTGRTLKDYYAKRVEGLDLPEMPGRFSRPAEERGGRGWTEALVSLAAGAAMILALATYKPDPVLNANIRYLIEDEGFHGQVRASFEAFVNIVREGGDR